MNDLVWKSILGLIALVVGTISVLLFKGKQDNPVEEVSEMIVYQMTGVDIDLTPTSKEE